ncbi:AbrB/MazE/SpoVT family DNA-binding domain-containing protein [Candidatus Woesearchaeota archaeon]|nr:AbrB/MazE/SpoVT family DNA-binding domain-containing protein [Candidatus Woesearchaeota archaeon]
MAIQVKAKQWGNSIGIVIPKEVVDSLKIKPEEEILIQVEKKENPLKELFGSGKHNPITREDFLKFRKEFKISKWW